MFVFYWLIGVCGGSQPPQTKRVKSVVANYLGKTFLPHSLSHRTYRAVAVQFQFFEHHLKDNVNQL